MSDKTALERLIDILDDPIDSILPLLHDGKDKKIDLADLINIVKELFEENEKLAIQYQEISKKHESDVPKGLSGLSEIIGDENVDAETLWGQVELQNKALNKLLKKSKKILEKAPEKIVVLDLKQILSESDEDESDDSENDNSKQSDDDEGSADSETRRIRKRMDRAMEDMDDDEGEGSGDDEGSDEDEEVKKEEKKASGDEE